MTIRAGSRVDAIDLVLPDVVTDFGNGTNTVTATAWAVLPTVTCSVDVVNDHPSATMLVDVRYSAWLASTVGASLRVGIDVSGALTIAPGVGGGAAAGWGEILLTTYEQTQQQQQASCTLECPPGTTTIAIWAYRSAASGTHTCNYPTLRAIPVRYLQ